MSAGGHTVFSGRGTRVLGSILVVSAVLLSGHLIPGFDNSRVDDGIRNGLHVVAFAAFALIVFENLKVIGVVKAVVLTVLLVIFIGGGAEYIQFRTGKQPDLTDLVRDVVGAVLALGARLCCMASSADDQNSARRYSLRGLASLLGIAVFVPVLFWFSIIGAGRLASPVIIDFSQWWHAYVYRPVNTVIEAPLSSAGAADIALEKRPRSGLIVSPMMTDWCDFRSLVIVAQMTVGTRADITVRINDSARKNEWSDRFIASIVVTDERSILKIPLASMLTEPGEPDMNVSDIQELVIFSRDSQRGSVLRIVDIRLE